MIKGCIDPGHAKNTPGKRYGTNPTFYEYISNRKVAVKLKKLLEDTGKFQIIYSVDLDDPVDKSLSARAEVAREAECDFFVSIHSNAGPESARGTSTYIHTNTQASVPFAEVIQQSMVEVLGTRNRGVHRANFGVLRGTYQHMLSCLTEGEFFTNTDARKWMLTEDYSDKYAQGVAQGLFEHYGITPIQIGLDKFRESENMILRKGDKGSEVKVLQEKLLKAGEKLPRYGADGDFGNETEEAVKSFQVRHKLTVDGIAGPQTFGKLDEVLAPKESKPEPTKPKTTFTLGGKKYEIREL